MDASHTTDTRPLRRGFAPLFALALALLAWWAPLNRQAEDHIEAGLKRALATYAVARTIHGVMSGLNDNNLFDAFKRQEEKWPRRSGIS